MTPVDPMIRFLGVPSKATPEEILDLPKVGLHSRESLRDALRLRLKRLREHPAADSPDGARVELQLQQAATALLQSIEPGRTTTSVAPARNMRSRPQKIDPRAAASRLSGHRRAPVLTEFDRQVLAILVGCGGWNARSRAYLVGLASSYGVNVNALMRVVKGLGEYARSGGEPFHVEDLQTPDDPRFRYQLSLPPVPGGHARDRMEKQNRIIERLLPEIKDDKPSSVAKVATLFALVTIFVIVGAIRIAMMPDEVPSPATTSQQASTANGESPEQKSRPLSGSAKAPLDVMAYDKPPTFRGNGLPIEATEAADQCATLDPYLDDVARNISVNGRLSEASKQSWKVSVQTMASGWGLLGEAQRQRLDEKVAVIFYAAVDSPTVVDELIAELTPEVNYLNDPMQIYTEAWRAGMLGRIASSDNLPPVVGEAATALYEDRLGRRDEGAAIGTFIPSARDWLKHAIPMLVERVQFDRSMHDYWELWLAANDKLREADRTPWAREHHQQLIMNAVENIALTSADLTRQSALTDVLGRLLQKADFDSSSVVRDEFIALYDNPRITENDLWVITSIVARYANVPWFEERYVLSPDENQAGRRRWRDRVAAAWPEMLTAPGNNGNRRLARGIAVDPVALDEWRASLANALSEKITADPHILIEQLVIAGRLNAAAILMTRQKSAEVQEQLLELQVMGTMQNGSSSNGGGAGFGGGATPPGSGRPGGLTRGPSRNSGRSPNLQGSGSGGSNGANIPSTTLDVDGEWAKLYQQSMRSEEQKLDLLAFLRNNGVTSLGPIDAATFVNEVYRGRPESVREYAQGLLSVDLATSLPVAKEAMDQFHRASRRQETADCISNLTGRILPRPNEPTFDAESRLALVDHVLSLMNRSTDIVDDGAELISNLYEIRFLEHNRQPQAITPGAAPFEIARSLLHILRRNADGLVASNPVPGTLTALARRHETRVGLADGVVQEFVVMQIGILEVLAYVTVAEQPELENNIRRLLDDCAESRRNARHVLEQAVLVERAMAVVWSLRLADPNAEMKREAGGAL